MDVDLGLSSSLREEIVRVVVNHCSARKIVIYGSRARGDYNGRSDIDVAVDCADDIGYLRPILDEDVRTLAKFDVVNLRTVDASLKEEIDREGVVVYEKA